MSIIEISVLNCCLDMNFNQEKYNMQDGYDPLINIRNFSYDLQDLINEVIELRIENKQLRDQVKQYDEFLNKQLERNNEMTAQIFKDLVGMNAENK